MELLTILVEKGLLGLVLLGLGAYFAHRLERYKASNAYFHALSNQKLKAYEEVAELVGRQVSRTHVFLHRITAIRSETPCEKEDAAKLLMSDYEELRKEYALEAPRMIACSLYFTEELGKCITDHLSRFHAVFLAFSNCSVEALGRELAALTESSTQVQVRLREEMYRNPFV